jgi:hypothetical protein
MVIAQCHLIEGYLRRLTILLNGINEPRSFMLPTFLLKARLGDCIGFRKVDIRRCSSSNSVDSKWDSKVPT